jgi:CheY-like chemotaxis protein
MASRAVLCVDDDQSRLSFRRTWLESSGFEVLAASNVEEAMTIFESQPIAAVVLDYSVPDIEGWLALIHLKKLKQRVPKILLTDVLSDDASVSDAVSQIVDVVVRKTQDPNELVSRLESLISLRSHSHPELESEYVVFADSSRRYTDCSDGVCQLLGYPRMELLNMTIDQVSYRSEKASALFEKYVERGSMDGQYILKHRSRKPLFITYRSQIFPDGCMAAVWEPVTGWKQLYQAALLEFDSEKLREQIEVAEAAVQERIRELAEDPDRNISERQEIDDALSGLKVLRREIRS